MTAVCHKGFLDRTPEDGWAACVPTLRPECSRLRRELREPLYMVPWMTKKVKPGLLHRLGQGLPFYSMAPEILSEQKLTKMGVAVQINLKQGGSSINNSWSRE